MGNKSLRMASFVIFACMTIALGGCEGKTANTADPPQKEAEPAKAVHDPVTLTFYSQKNTVVSEDMFNMINETVKKKYPYISLNYTGGSQPEKLIAAGTIPDIIAVSPSQFTDYSGLKLAGDLGPLIKKYNFDMSQLDPVTVSYVKSYFPGAGTPAMVFKNGANMLLYNKSLFDKFGVAYPTDLMSWDDTYNLAKKMTRTDGDTQYKGLLVSDGQYSNSNTLGIDYIDPKTEKANFANNPGLRTYFENLYRIFNIPGNEPPSTRKERNDKNGEFLKGKYAMWFAGLSEMAGLDKVTAFDWDLVTEPTFIPGVGSVTQGNAIIIPDGKHKDDAFVVLTTVLSDEVQTMFSRSGIIPALNKQSVREVFMKDSAFSKKNVAAIFKLPKSAERKNISPYDKQAVEAIQDEWINYKVKDINTSLRDAEEAANKAINQVKSQ